MAEASTTRRRGSGTTTLRPTRTRRHGARESLTRRASAARTCTRLLRPPCSTTRWRGAATLRQTWTTSASCRCPEGSCGGSSGPGSVLLRDLLFQLRDDVVVPLAGVVHLL